MRIVKLYGGLGNQMFQYAFSRGLSRACGEEPLYDYGSVGVDAAHNGYELDRVFGLDLPAARREDCLRLAVPPTGVVNRIRRKYLTKSSHRIDRKFGYQPELLSLPGDLYYEGYWQSEKYFKPAEAEIRAAFAFRGALSDENERTLSGIKRPVASVHVRRGDYLASENLNVCTPEYYRAAVASLGVAISSVLVFSDDIEYCRSTLDLGGVPAVYVDRNRGADSWQDMAMMSRCDHHVIANSSFSWWGAWLNRSVCKRVVAPSPWNGREVRDTDRYYSFSFADVVPEAWERVSV